MAGVPREFMLVKEVRVESPDAPLGAGARRDASLDSAGQVVEHAQVAPFVEVRILLPGDGEGGPRQIDGVLRYEALQEPPGCVGRIHGGERNTRLSERLVGEAVDIGVPDGAAVRLGAPPRQPLLVT